LAESSREDRSSGELVRLTDVEALLHENLRAYAVTWLGTTDDRDKIARSVSPITYVRAGVPPILTIHGSRYFRSLSAGGSLTRSLIENWCSESIGHSQEKGMVTSLSKKTIRSGMKSELFFPRSGSHRFRTRFRFFDFDGFLHIAEKALLNNIDTNEQYVFQQFIFKCRDHLKHREREYIPNTKVQC
jgi:hypothetical protein